ncbi:MAG: hypothetical protein V7666_09650 [Sulfitobacter sp.]|uniref:hypothetical protein n=1 Tax=Sulfitobacter sp. TaxID=1903071 RepID=UPI0030013D77
MTDEIFKSREEWILQLTTFESAVEWAKTSITTIQSLYPRLFEPGGLEEAYCQQDGRQAFKFRGEYLAEMASTHYPSHRAMMLGCAYYIREKKQPPDWALEWLASYLEGNGPVPKPPRGAPNMKGLHDHICRLIDTLVDLGWVATRNDATAKPSACDVLAEALLQMKLKPATFEGVKGLFVQWTKDNGDNEQALKRLSKKKH